jgi:hypothetical protein
LRFMPYLLSHVAGTILTVAVVAWALASGTLLGLDELSIVRSAAYGVMGVVMFGLYWGKTAAEPHFRWPAIHQSREPRD